MNNNINWQKVEKPFRNTEIYTVTDREPGQAVAVLFLLHDDVDIAHGHFDGSQFIDNAHYHGYTPSKVAYYAEIGLPAGHAEAVAKLDYDRSHTWAVVRYNTVQGVDVVGVGEPGDGVSRLTWDEANAQMTGVAAELCLPGDEGEYDITDIVEVYEPRSTEVVIALDNPTMADAAMGMAGVPAHAVDRYVARLEEHGYTVVLRG